MSSAQGAGQPARTFVCPHCERPAAGHVRGLVVRDIFDDRYDHNDWDGPPAEYALLQCGECGNVSVQLREDYGHGFDEDDNPVIVFPPQRQLSWVVPEPLRREFEEAQACFKAKAYKATVVMVRQVLEATCEENNVHERTLAKSLDKMKADGLIDTIIAEWANALRILGNEGAHYTGNPLPRDDAEDALAFAEALLDHIYVLRKRFEKFADRRASKRSDHGDRQVPK